MALLDPTESLDPPHRPDWRSALSTAQFGPIAEDLLGVSLAAAGSGAATMARPIVDRGVDLYLRRVRSLRTVPIQVKAFQSLTPDGNGRFDLPVKEVIDDPNAYLAVVHVPAPHDQLYRRFFLIPFRVFRDRCPRGIVQDRECFLFSGNFSGLGSGLWSDHLRDIDPAGLVGVDSGLDVADSARATSAAVPSGRSGNGTHYVARRHRPPLGGDRARARRRWVHRHCARPDPSGYGDVLNSRLV